MTAIVKANNRIYELEKENKKLRKENEQLKEQNRKLYKCALTTKTIGD